MKRISNASKMRAYQRGYKAGQSGKPFVCPFTNGKLMDKWIHGYQIGSK